MSKKLEQFIRQHRAEFDDATPSDEVWNRLQGQMAHAEKNKGKQGKVSAMIWFRVGVAATLLAAISIAAFFWIKAPHQPPASATINNTARDPLKEVNPRYAEEMSHFTRLIELNKEELKQIEKDDPQLYQKFIADINHLDSSYNSLRGQLPGNPNREQLLEAMIENLRLQSELLNQQLFIIQEIKKAKDKSHETSNKI